MTAPETPFVPVGLPPEARADDSLDQRVGLHLLDALDSLDAIYDSAAFFARVDAEVPVEEYTLTRCLESVHRDSGALWLYHGNRLVLQCDRGGAAARVDLHEVVRSMANGQPSFHNGSDGQRLVVAGTPACNVLVCPFHTGPRQIGCVVALSPPDQVFDTGDVKIVRAVTSQAAIALSRSQHFRDVEIERRKLQLVVENHTDGIGVLDRHGVTKLCNPIAREYCGTSDLLPALAAIDPTFTMQALGAGPTERELQVSAGGNSRILGITTRDIRSRDGELVNVILALRDLTRHRREERLKRDFLSLLSHKFRTPLTALICSLQMMEGASDVERGEFVTEMSRRTQELGTMVDRLLYFTELLEGSWAKKGTANLRQICDDLAANLASQHGRPVLRLDLADDALVVPVPPSRLRVALVNLIDNAIKFGTIAEPWVCIHSHRTSNGGIAVEVEDRGPGIPADARAGLFASFQQLDAEFTGNVEGAGIGLAMVREITTGLGGTLDHRDAVPQGCVFTLTFPLAHDGATA